VDDGVEDSSTVSLIQLGEETVEQGILALDTQKGPGPDGISPLIRKNDAVYTDFSKAFDRVNCCWAR
jgi:hypothetical protein